MDSSTVYGHVFMLIFAAAILLLLYTLYMRQQKKSFYTDPLTGVGSKSYFISKYRSRISDKNREKYYIIFLCFDISHVNSYYGREEAENMLRHAAKVLGSSIGKTDFFGRVSGGGFAAACMFSDRSEAEDWIISVLPQINEYGKKFGRDYVPEFRAGIYHLCTGDISCEEALFAALLRYKSAASLSPAYSFIEENELNAIHETETLGKQAIRSLETQEFRCYLQMVSDVKTGSFCGAEMLSRWQHPVKGLLKPEKYIAQMEENGTITELDFYMIEQSCRTLELLQKAGSSLQILCNVSRKSLSRPDFFARLTALSKKFSFPHNRLCIEVTESCMFGNSALAESNLLRCKNAGFMVVLDDLGTGYTSFADIVHIPIDMVKFDREILLNAELERGRRLMQGMNTMFHYMNVTTLCEGIESPAQLESMREMGIDIVQGFYIAEPRPLEEALDSLCCVKT